LPTDLQERVLKTLRSSLPSKDLAQLRRVNKTFATALGPPTPPRSRAYYAAIFEAFKEVCDRMPNFVGKGVLAVDVYLEWKAKPPHGTKKADVDVVLHVNAVDKYPLRVGIVINNVTKTVVEHANKLRKDFMSITRVHPAEPDDFKVVLIVSFADRRRSPKQLEVHVNKTVAATTQFVALTGEALGAALGRLVEACAAA
jgi:hypothetical protein